MISSFFNLVIQLTFSLHYLSLCLLISSLVVEIEVPENAGKGYDNLSLMKDNVVATFDVSQIFPLFGERQGRTKRYILSIYLSSMDNTSLCSLSICIVSHPSLPLYLIGNR